MAGRFDFHATALSGAVIDQATSSPKTSDAQDVAISGVVGVGGTARGPSYPIPGREAHLRGNNPEA